LRQGPACTCSPDRDAGRRAGAPDSFWGAIGKTKDDFAGLTWGNFLVGNLLPVTAGNIIGGSLMVAAVYWFVYLRKRAE